MNKYIYALIIALGMNAGLMTASSRLAKLAMVGGSTAATGSALFAVATHLRANECDESPTARAAMEKEASLHRTFRNVFAVTTVIGIGAATAGCLDYF